MIIIIVTPLFVETLPEKIHPVKKTKRQHRYRRSDNQLFVLSDDQAPRWMPGSLEIFSDLIVDKSPLFLGGHPQSPNTFYG